MASLRADFDELIRRVEAGREFAHASFEPIFYLVFHPRDVLEAKRLMPAWTSKLRNNGLAGRDILDCRTHCRHPCKGPASQGLVGS